MSRNASNHPELLIPPPFLNAHSTPPHFQNTSGKNRDEKRDEEQTCKSANRRHDKFASQQADGWKSTVGNQWKGSERIDNGVDISESLEPFEPASSIAIPNWAMSTNENFH
eukprot:Gb_31847 [translate_table: standard]